jgi:hypothetical protein
LKIKDEENNKLIEKLKEVIKEKERKEEDQMQQLSQLKKNQEIQKQVIESLRTII